MAAGKDLGRDPDGPDPDGHEPGAHEPDAHHPDAQPLGADGLPEIDPEIDPQIEIVVPDDISALERDVQAYHRERRRDRRLALARRFVPGFSRLGPYGVLAPIIAAVLVVTAVLGSMVSLLGPRSTTPPAGSSRGQGQGGPATMAPEAGVGRPLPTAAVFVDGAGTPLERIRSAVVVAVPAGCSCRAAVDAVTSVARQAGVRVYLSGVTGEITDLASREGSYPHVLSGAEPSLDRTYSPHGLSAVLVGQDGRVTRVERDLTADRSLTNDQLTGLLATPSP